MRGTVVLVLLDAPRTAAAALPVARTVARLHQATLHLVHSAARDGQPAELLMRLGLQADDLRGAILDAVADELPEALARLVRQEERATIVLAAGYRPELERLIRSPACPLILVPPDRRPEPWTLRRLLLLHDGTPSTSVAVRPAAELAHEAGAELLVLHVGDGSGHVPAEPGTLAVPRYLDQPQHEWPAWADEFLARLACFCPIDPGRIRLRLARGETALEILRLASQERSDLIVLAQDGADQSAGSGTLERILEESPCPVMLVPKLPTFQNSPEHRRDR